MRAIEIALSLLSVGALAGLTLVPAKPVVVHPQAVASPAAPAQQPATPESIIPLQAANTLAVVLTQCDAFPGLVGTTAYVLDVDGTGRAFDGGDNRRRGFGGPVGVSMQLHIIRGVWCLNWRIIPNNRQIIHNYGSEAIIDGAGNVAPFVPVPWHPCDQERGGDPHGLTFSEPGFVWAVQ